MPIERSCRCGHNFKVPRRSNEKSIRCPECNRRIGVAGDDSEEAVTARRVWLIGGLVVGLIAVGLIGVGLVVAFLPRAPKPIATVETPRGNEVPTSSTAFEPVDPPMPAPVEPMPPSVPDREAVELRQIAGDFKALATAPDGKEFLLATYTTIYRIDAATGASKGEFKNIAGFAGLRHFAVAPDGKSMVIASDEKVYVGEFPAGTLRKEFKLSGGRLDRAAFSPDGKSLHVFGGISGKKAWETWDLSSGTPTAQVSVQGTLSLLASTPDGRRGLGQTGGSVEQSLSVLDFAKGEVIRPIDIAYLSNVVITPDGKLAIGGWGKMIRAVDLRTSRLVWDGSIPGYSLQGGLQVSGDGTRVIVAGTR